VETDGTITPEDALAESLKIIIDHFTFLYKEMGFDQLKKDEKIDEPEEIKESSEEKPKKTKKTASKKKAK
jgi:DNA-directed RNA polymerase alpha subunit